jgi:hypothetical protein
MSSSLVIPVVLQFAVPFALLGWQAAGRDRNIVAWGLKHVAAWTYIYATSIAGLWLLVPWYVPHILMVISISLAAHTQRPGPIWDVFVGDPLPVTFDGRYLIRNDRLTVFEASRKSTTSSVFGGAAVQA